MALCGGRNTGANSGPMIKLLDILFCVLCFFPSDIEREKSDITRVFWPAIVASQKM